MPWTTYPIDLASRMPGYPANPTVNPYPEAGYYDIKSPREEFERSLVWQEGHKISVLGHNFAPFGREVHGETHGQLLCTYGFEQTEIDPTGALVANYTELVDRLDNVVHGSYVSSTELRCPTPSRPAGTTIHVHVSITGYGNFSDDFVEVT